MSDSARSGDRVAVITGASSGIGDHCARVLAARGFPVALLARRADKLQALVDAIREAGGRAEAYPVDVTDAAALASVAGAVAAALGPAGIVVNNAGIMLPTPVTSDDEGAWTQQVDLNIGGLNNTVRAFTGQLIETAKATGVADLINTASIAAHTLFPTFSVYAASKAYVSHFGRNLRAELGPRGVRVTTLEPGIVDTELQGHIPDGGVRARLEGTREQIEWLQPSDLAELVEFVVTRSPRVNLAQVAILPTRQVS